MPFIKRLISGFSRFMFSGAKRSESKVEVKKLREIPHVSEPVEGQALLPADGIKPCYSLERVGKSKSTNRKESYAIQIGFDYGTSFSKCVCRDLITDRAWVFVAGGDQDQPNEFLIPSNIRFEGGRFRLNTKRDLHYPKRGLYHLKLALEKVARQDWSDPVLEPFKSLSGFKDANSIRKFVMEANVYFLTHALAGVRDSIVARYGDFGVHPGDTAYVNMAIPVADATSPEVRQTFIDVLRRAWRLSGKLELLDSNFLIDQMEDPQESHSNADSPIFDPCFIYPEISANVQGFVRSRSASEGLYLFTDVGAGTVDQSMFLFAKRDDLEWLTYLYACVLPLGSSQIEIRAAMQDGGINPETLEAWRIRKENGVSSDKLQAARNEVADGIKRGMHRTLGYSIRKLYLPEQLAATRLLFGGGGHCRDPYEAAVISKFGRPWIIGDIKPDVVGMPQPKDLELDTENRGWMSRLYVAYGLSFYRSDLAGHTFPDDVEDVPAEERRVMHDGIRSAPTKDCC